MSGASQGQKPKFKHCNSIFCFPFSCSEVPNTNQRYLFGSLLELGPGRKSTLHGYHCAGYGYPVQPGILFEPISYVRCNIYAVCTWIPIYLTFKIVPDWPGNKIEAGTDPASVPVPDLSRIFWPGPSSTVLAEA